MNHAVDGIQLTGSDWKEAAEALMFVDALVDTQPEQLYLGAAVDLITFQLA